LSVECIDNKDIIIEREKRYNYVNYLEEVLRNKVLVLLDTIGKNNELEDKFVYLVLKLFPSALINLAIGNF